MVILKVDAGNEFGFVPETPEMAADRERSLEEALADIAAMEEEVNG